MNVGVLTFHMAHNCGAMLQAYALCKSVMSLVPCVCEVIDYRLPDIYNKYEQFLHMIPVDPKRLKFDAFMKDVLPLSSQIDNLAKARAYDLYIVGSDQVWNPYITHGYKEEYFAKHFPREAYCISYAASTGEHIKEPELFAKRLERFQYVGVRESWAKKELSPFYHGEIALCLDPVLLIDAEDWKQPLRVQKRHPYILIYAFEMTEIEYIEIIEWSKLQHLDIIELVTHVRTKRPGIMYEEDYGPHEFLFFIQNAKYVHTDSYHGTLFSIIFEKPFFYLSHGRGENARIGDIVHLLAVSRDEHGFFLRTDRTIHRLSESRTESINFLKKGLGKARNENTEI